jgi:hypothetical protein
MFNDLNEKSDDELIAIADGKIPYTLSAGSTTTPEDIKSQAKAILHKRQKKWYEKPFGIVFLGLIAGLLAAILFHHAFIPLLLVAIIFSLIIRSMKKAKSPRSKEFICGNCGSMGKAKRAVKGSFWIELLLWLCFILPGLIYSIWRLTSRHSACQECGSSELVPVDSPRGKKLIAEFK